MHSRVLLFRSCVILAVAGCGDGPAALSGPGDVEVRLISPHIIEGAAFIEISGPGIQSARMENGALFFDASTTPVRVVVVLTTPRTIAFTMSVADRGVEFTATVVEVAARDNTLRDASRYAVEFLPVAPQ